MIQAPEWSISQHGLGQADLSCMEPRAWAVTKEVLSVFNKMLLKWHHNNMSKECVTVSVPWNWF